MAIGISQTAGALSLTVGLLWSLLRGYRYPPIYLITAESFGLLGLFAGVQLLRRTAEGLTITRFILAVQIVEVWSRRIVFYAVLGLHAGCEFGSNFIKFRAGFTGELIMGRDTPFNTVVGINLVALASFLYLRAAGPVERNGNSAASEEHAV
jgi:hypothetical protein